jgi:hypothetical protein
LTSCHIKRIIDSMKHKDITGQRFGRLVAVTFKGSGIWICKCDCGKTVERGVTRLHQKYNRWIGERSCGCIQKEKMSDGRASLRQLYQKYKIGAGKKGRIFTLSEPWFENLTKQNCYYCDSPPSQRFQFKRGWGAYTYNGIDRLDNKRGYTMDNSVPCCKKCNTMKLNMSVDDFFGQMRRVLQLVRPQEPPHVRYRTV